MQKRSKKCQCRVVSGCKTCCKQAAPWSLHIQSVNPPGMHQLLPWNSILCNLVHLEAATSQWHSWYRIKPYQTNHQIRLLVSWLRIMTYDIWPQVPRSTFCGRNPPNPSPYSGSKPTLLLNCSRCDPERGLQSWFRPAKSETRNRLDFWVALRIGTQLLCRSLSLVPTKIY